MPLQNRVQPDGSITADAARGTFMGNRGILHRADRTLGKARWTHHHWVTCLLAFKGRRRPLMAPRSYTELFFLDEAVALAAGHRPCAECRRADYLRFRTCWSHAFGTHPPLADLDRQMHQSRIDPATREHLTHQAALDDLPDGAFLLHNAAPHLVWGQHLLPCTPLGYGTALPRPQKGDAVVLTPAVTVAVLHAGYRPVLARTAHFGQVP